MNITRARKQERENEILFRLCKSSQEEAGTVFHKKEQRKNEILFHLRKSSPLSLEKIVPKPQP